ncbi:MAG TPA: class I lanthipeptide [Thermoanaerobaculia bacterium]
MDKNAKKKPMFLMKETLVNLTPGQMGQVQGATGCIGVTTATFDIGQIKKSCGCC